MSEAELIARMHTEWASGAPDLEYTPIAAPLPELVRPAEVAALRQRVVELEAALNDAQLQITRERNNCAWIGARSEEQAARIKELEAQLADATQRAEAAEKDANELRADNETSAHYAARALHAEAVLAAVPVGAIRRYFEHSDAFRDVQNGEYDIDQARWDCQWIADLLDAQPEVQP